MPQGRSRFHRVLSLLAPLIGWAFGHMSYAIPVKRLRETDHLLAFHHPNPGHPFHVILTPKKDIRAFIDLDPSDSFLADLVATSKSLINEYHLISWRLIVNGGENQDFPHLHFHLVSDDVP